MLKIIITGLIAYFPIYADLDNPDPAQSEMLAVLIADAGHVAQLYPGCYSEGFDGDTGKPLGCSKPISLDGVEVAIKGSDQFALASANLFNPANGHTELIKMSDMRLATELDDPGEIDPGRIKLDSGLVASRVHLTEGVIDVGRLRAPEYQMIDSNGEYARHARRTIAEVIEYEVPVPDGQNPMILLDGVEREVKRKRIIGGQNYWYVFITNTPPEDWRCTCHKDRLEHTAKAYGLSKNPGTAIPYTAEDSKGKRCFFCCREFDPKPCRPCGGTSSPGGGPVRCPGFLFNAITSL